MHMILLCCKTLALSFNDLQQGLRSANQGTPHDRSTTFALIGMVAAVVVVGLILHLRQRRKQAGPPTSTARLAWELSRTIPLSLRSRMLLIWVARSANAPLATLLLSAQIFDAALLTWSNQPTFSPIRRWGKSQLAALRPVLFDDHF